MEILPATSLNADLIFLEQVSKSGIYELESGANERSKTKPFETRFYLQGN